MKVPPLRSHRHGVWNAVRAAYWSPTSTASSRCCSDPFLTEEAGKRSLTKEPLSSLSVSSRLLPSSRARTETRARARAHLHEHAPLNSSTSEWLRHNRKCTDFPEESAVSVVTGNRAAAAAADTSLYSKQVCDGVSLREIAQFQLFCLSVRRYPLTSSQVWKLNIQLTSVYLRISISFPIYPGKWLSLLFITAQKRPL